MMTFWVSLVNFFPAPPAPAVTGQERWERTVKCRLPVMSAGGERLFRSYPGSNVPRRVR